MTRHMKKAIENVLLKKLTYKQYKYFYNKIRYIVKPYLNMQDVKIKYLLEKWGEFYLTFELNDWVYYIPLKYMPKE